MWYKSGQAVSAYYLYSSIPVQFKGRLKMFLCPTPIPANRWCFAAVHSSASTLAYCIVLHYHTCDTRFRRRNDKLPDTPATASSWLSIFKMFSWTALLYGSLNQRGEAAAIRYTYVVASHPKSSVPKILWTLWYYYCMRITCSPITAMILGWLNITWYYKETSR